MKKLLFITLAIVLNANAQLLNSPDEMINLALTDDATVSGSVTGGRGVPRDILYNPTKGNYETPSFYSEYGVNFRENIGVVTLDNPFYWQVEWSETKLINYITFGGTYPNQPQPDTRWRVVVTIATQDTIIAEGVGGWIDSGIFEWKSENLQPIYADKVRVEIYNPFDNLLSIHLRARGGLNQRMDDTATETKATLIQLLPYTFIPPPDDTIDDVVNENVAEELIKIINDLKSELIKIKVETISNKKKIDILKARIEQ